MRIKLKKFDWDKKILYEENKVLNDCFKERKDLTDEYVVKDYR